MPHAEKDTVNGEVTTPLTNGEKPQSKVLSVCTIPSHWFIYRRNRAATFHPTSHAVLRMLRWLLTKIEAPSNLPRGARLP